MKKIIFSLVVCMCIGFSAKSQDIGDPAYINKRGVALLPHAGDFALGIDATPFLRYLGNFFTRSENDAPDFNGVEQSIYGKYFLQDNRAIRVKLSVNVLNNTEKGVVTNDEQIANNPLNPYATVIDVWNATNTDVHLGLGYEFRRGEGRVQGFWGGEILLGYGSGKDKFEYANPMTAVNRKPTSTYFNRNIDDSDPYRRRTETKNGNKITGGLGAFVGVEYFFAPRISIGGEFGLGFVYCSAGQSVRTWEYWDVSAGKLQTTTERRNGRRWDAETIGVFTRASYGSIFLMLHF